MEPSKLTRRAFIGTTAMAGGVMALTPAGLSQYFFGTGSELKSAAYTPLNVKFVQTGVIHEETFEGSCRHGPLENLTQEAETGYMKAALERLVKQVDEYPFKQGIKTLQPEGVFMWVERANPEIMLKSEELEKLAGDDPSTDVYVVQGGLPQYTCLRIAERFNKPVILANVAGWGLDAPAGLRAKGHEGFYVQDMDQLADLLMAFKARKAIRQTKFLDVTNFTEVPKGVISSISSLEAMEQQFGVGARTVDYKEFFTEMEKLVNDSDFRKKAGNLAGELLSGASGTNMNKEDVSRSFDFYLTVLHFLNKYECNSFGIECFELCSSMEPWNRRFTPCMTHSLLKNAGFPSTCEKDLNALLAMSVMMYVTHKPAYMGNPDFNLDNNILTLHHSDSPTKMDGFDQPADYYEIKSFTESGFGASLRYDYEQKKGQAVTLSRFDPGGKKIIVASGQIAGGGGLDGFGCSQRIDIQLNNAREMQRRMQNYGHHLAMVFGDCTEQIRDLGELMDFEIELV